MTKIEFFDLLLFRFVFGNGGKVFRESLSDIEKFGTVNSVFPVDQFFI